MEDTRLIGFLISHHVSTPAEQSAKVHVRVRCVGDHAVASSGDVAGGGQQGRGERVVE